eukprot:1140686-Pelagomonas_calceolata.AAC.2
MPLPMQRWFKRDIYQHAGTATPTANSSLRLRTWTMLSSLTHICLQTAEHMQKHTLPKKRKEEKKKSTPAREMSNQG